MKTNGRVQRNLKKKDGWWQNGLLAAFHGDPCTLQKHRKKVCFFCLQTLPPFSAPSAYMYLSPYSKSPPKYTSLPLSSRSLAKKKKRGQPETFKTQNSRQGWACVNTLKLLLFFRSPFGFLRTKSGLRGCLISKDVRDALNNQVPQRKARRRQCNP